jgi:hypothetical protein
MCKVREFLIGLSRTRTGVSLLLIAMGAVVGLTCERLGFSENSCLVAATLVIFAGVVTFHKQLGISFRLD